MHPLGRLTIKNHGYKLSRQGRGRMSFHSSIDNYCFSFFPRFFHSCRRFVLHMHPLERLTIKNHGYKFNRQRRGRMVFRSWIDNWFSFPPPSFWPLPALVSTLIYSEINYIHYFLLDHSGVSGSLENGRINAFFKCSQDSFIEVVETSARNVFRSVLLY